MGKHGIGRAGVAALAVVVMSACGVTDEDADALEARKPPRTPDAAPPPPPPAPDAAMPTPSADCVPDIDHQAGCGAGEKCTYATTAFTPPGGALACAVAGTQAWFQACTFDAYGIDDCGPGFYCYREAANLGPVCVPICAPDFEFYGCVCQSFADLGWNMTPDTYGLCL